MITMSWRVRDDALVVNDEHCDPLMVVTFRASWTNEDKRRVLRAILSVVDAVPGGAGTRTLDVDERLDELERERAERL